MSWHAARHDGVQAHDFFTSTTPKWRRMLAADSTLYPVAIARFAETAEWLEAPEAGATDYLEMPCEL